MSFQQGTVLSIVQQVMEELGFTSPSAVAGTSDPTIAQFGALLKASVYELSQVYPWEQRQKEMTITTVASTETYSLPSDFGYLVDQTQWDRTNQWPLLGPASAQQWQFLKGGFATSNIRYKYRLRQNLFYLHPTPGATGGGETLAMEYVSNAWYLTAGSDETVQTNYIEEFTDDGDIVYLDKWLVMRYLKLKFWETKGFDTTAFRDDFLTVFNAVTGKNKGAPVLSLVPRAPEVLLGPWNVPEGNWNV